MIRKNRMKAIEKHLNGGDKIPVGILYQEERLTSEARESALEHSTLIEKN